MSYKMSLNPLNELKRRIEDDAKPLPKRLCLVKNIIHSHHFPNASYERIVAQWLKKLSDHNDLSCEEIKSVLNWFSGTDNFTNELKSKLIQMVAQFVQRNPVQIDDVQYILSFLENPSMSSQLNIHTGEYLTIIITILQNLKNDYNHVLGQKILDNMKEYYKESKKKLELIVKFLDGENLETIFSYLDTECRNTAIELCQAILFPRNKKSFFISYLQALIRKDNIDELIAVKGDNIQSVLIIMGAFFNFPKGRTENKSIFLRDFIDVFVSCYRSENQLIFAFYIMVANFLDMKQSYISPAMNMPTVIFEENGEKIKRQLFLDILEILHMNEIDISVRLTDTFGEKISKVEIKKNFSYFLQAVMMGQLKLEGKPDKTTLQIIKTALKLDPVLIEQKINEILPPLMIMKKNSTSTLESYKEMFNYLLEILFKLSRGTLFLNQILPFVKTNLEACNTEQFELKQKVKECSENGIDCEKIISKIISGNDLFPEECIKKYGKLTAELMFRQNKELLESLQKDFELHCLMMLEEGFVSPSIITLAEVLSAILSSFLEHSKMADHTVPAQIAQDFWKAYQNFEEECLKKFGQCILKLSYNPSLVTSFLKLCLSYSQLKLLNIKYSNVKMEISPVVDTQDVFDLSVLLPCLNKEQWTVLGSSIQEDEAVLILDNLLLCKVMALELLSLSTEDTNQAITLTKTHLIKQLSTKPETLDTNKYFARVLFSNLDKTQTKQLAKSLIKLYLNRPETEIFNHVAITNNRILLNTLVLETSKNIIKLFNNCEALSKAISKSDFDMSSFSKEVNMKEYFGEMKIQEDQDGIVKNYLEILEHLQLHDLEEKHKLTAIFVLLALKNCCQSKKIRRNIDYILQSIYELSAYPPDLYKIFPVDFIFSFKDKTMMDLLTLTIKTSNNTIIIKNILESAVKRVKMESNLVKNIVEILLSKNKLKSSSSIESFGDPAFQITCTILPFIVKQKKAITASAFRSILADQQDKLQKSLLELFKKIDFSKNGGLITEKTDNTVVESGDNVATLNAMAAYSLTLSRYCETTDLEEIKNLDYLWSGLEFFLQNAIQAIQNVQTKNHHVESAIQLINVTLRCIKKLETHPLFHDKDKLLLQIWRSIKTRLLLIYERGEKVSNVCLDNISVTLKFLCEMSSVDCFVNHFVLDLDKLVGLKKPSQIIKDSTKSDLISHKVSKYLWSYCLKANIVGPKCSALCKLMYKNIKNIRLWICQHYEASYDGVAMKKKKKLEFTNENENSVRIVKVDDIICDILKIDLDSLSDVILAGKKITLDYKFLDSIFELQHMLHYILGSNAVNVRCDVSCQAFFRIFEGCVAILNSLLLAREEILEDRWPCYMQCYRTLITSLCERSTSKVQLERSIEEKLAEIAHSVEKLTQSISKRKKQVSRIAAYTVADICSNIERNAPSRMVRQHLENSVALLIQASDSTYAMAFLKRGLAGSPGQMTMTNMYGMYKRYHKYVGNS